MCCVIFFIYPALAFVYFTVTCVATNQQVTAFKIFCHLELLLMLRSCDFFISAYWVYCRFVASRGRHGWLSICSSRIIQGLRIESYKYIGSQLIGQNIEYLSIIHLTIRILTSWLRIWTEIRIQVHGWISKGPKMRLEAKSTRKAQTRYRFILFHCIHFMRVQLILWQLMTKLFLIQLNRWIFLRLHDLLSLHYLRTLKYFAQRHNPLLYRLWYVILVRWHRIDWNELALITLIATAFTAILGHPSLYVFLSILTLTILLIT